MRAVVWQGKHNVEVSQVPDPEILNPRDAIVKVTLTAICGSDLHLYNGFIPTMQAGDVLGHEFMGEVAEVGREVKNLSKGDWVVVPFAIACCRCFFCERDLWSLCDNTNPNAGIADTAYGYSGAGLFGYSHMYGGYPGGQAEYVRVPFADVGPIKIYEPISDEQALFLSDIFPTGYMAAENCNIQPGDTIAVWGCGPVGLFAIKSAFMLGAERVIAIDRIADRHNDQGHDHATNHQIEILLSLLACRSLAQHLFARQRRGCALRGLCRRRSCRWSRYHGNGRRRAGVLLGSRLRVGGLPPRALMFRHSSSLK